jgi:hypothetical protein
MDFSGVTPNSIAPKEFLLSLSSATKGQVPTAEMKKQTKPKGQH